MSNSIDNSLLEQLYYPLRNLLQSSPKRKGNQFIIVFLSLFFIFPPIARAENHVVINEFLAHPSSGNNEWVEFYNPDKIDLSGYYLDDDTSFSDDIGSSPKKNLSSLSASNSAYPYLELNNAFLNNPGDNVVLFDSTGNIIDQYTYNKDPGENNIFGRSPDGIGEFQVLASATQGQPNSNPQPTPTQTPTNTPIPPTPTRTPTPTKTPTPSPTPKIPTPTQTPTPIKSVPTSKPTKTISPTTKITIKPSGKITGKLFPTSVLGTSTNSAKIKPSISKSKPRTLVQSASDTKSPSLIIPIAGAILFIACAILIALKIKKSKTLIHDS